MGGPTTLRDAHMECRMVSRNTICDHKYARPTDSMRNDSSQKENGYCLWDFIFYYRSTS